MLYIYIYIYIHIYIYIYIYIFKFPTADAADPDSSPSRHARDSDHVRQLSGGSQFGQLTYLRDSEGSSGCLGGSFGVSGGPGSIRGLREERQGSWGCLGLNSKPLLLRGKLIIKTWVLRLGRFLMKGRDLRIPLLFSWISVASPMRNREVNSLDKRIEIEDSQVEPL